MRGRRCCRRPRLCVLVGVLRVPPSLIESGKGKRVRTKFTPPSQASRNFIHCRPRPQQPHHHPPTTSTCTGAYLCVITPVVVPKSQPPHQRPGRPCPVAERRPPAPMKLHPLHHAMLVQVPCSLFVLYMRPQYSSRAQRNTKTGPAALVQARPPRHLELPNASRVGFLWLQVWGCPTLCPPGRNNLPLTRSIAPRPGKPTAHRQAALTHKSRR